MKSCRRPNNILVGNLDDFPCCRIVRLPNEPDRWFCIDCEREFVDVPPNNHVLPMIVALVLIFTFGAIALSSEERSKDDLQQSNNQEFVDRGE
jgi:hypothetical protein